MDIHPAPSAPKILLGSKASAGVSGIGTACAVFDGSELQALSIDDCPGVRLLDLSSCASLSWIGISGCRDLQVLVLPESGAGAEVHMDFGMSAPSLLVTGAVSDFDCCWADRAAAAPPDRRRRSALQGVFVGPVCAEMMTGGAELLMFIGGDADATIDFTRFPTAREILLADLPQVETVCLPSGAKAVTLQDMTGILEVSLDLIDVLRAERVPRLAQVRGSGWRISMVQSACSAPLNVLGMWDHVSVHEGGHFGVNAPLAGQLAAPNVVSGSGADAAIRALLANDAKGNDDAHETIVAWCQRVRPRSRTAIGALQALQQMAEGGLDPARLWKVRCGLHERQPASEVWHWDLPADLAQSGWAADLRLWLACQPLPAAALGGREPVWRPRHLATVLEALVEFVGTSREGLLLELLRSGYRSASYGSSHEEDIPPREIDLLRRSLQSLAGLRRRTFCPELIEAFCGWLRRNLHGLALANLLGALHLLGARSATDALLAEAVNSAAEPELRRRAAALAFQPARSALLSFAEVLHD